MEGGAKQKGIESDLDTFLTLMTLTSISVRHTTLLPVNQD